MPDLGPLDHAALRVQDLDASGAWYRRVLGLERVFADRWEGVPTVLVEPISGTGIALFPVTADRPAQATADHIAFRIQRSTIDDWRVRLTTCGVTVESQDHEVCTSLYFRDPDGHRLELVAYRDT